MIAFSPDSEVVARLVLASGVVPRACPPLDASDRLGQLARLLGASGVLPDGSDAVLVSSTDLPGSAPNVLGVQRVSAG